MKTYSGKDKDDLLLLFRQNMNMKSMVTMKNMETMEKSIRTMKKELKTMMIQDLIVYQVFRNFIQVKTPESHKKLLVRPMYKKIQRIVLRKNLVMLVNVEKSVETCYMNSNIQRNMIDVRILAW